MNNDQVRGAGSAFSFTRQTLLPHLGPLGTRK